MKQKWKVIGTIFLAILTGVLLMACGSGGEVSSSAQGGGAYNVGAFSVNLPKGWYAIPQTDIWAEKDEKGNIPVDEKSILLAKGTDDEWKALTGPNIRIYYHDADADLLDARSFYEDVQELTGVKVQGKDCDAFSAVSLGYKYDFLSFKTDDAQYEVNICTEIDDKETGIHLEDQDVQSILDSIKAN